MFLAKYVQKRVEKIIEKMIFEHRLHTYCMSKSVALLENAKLRHAGFDDSALPGRAARSGSGVGVARNL